MNTQFPIFDLEAKSYEQVMSPNDSDPNPRQPSAASGDIDTDVEQLNVVSDPFELFEGSRLISGASEVHERASRTSDVSSERLDRLEGLIEGMARQQAEFMANQRRMQEQLSQQAVATPRPSSERSFNGSSAFTDFIKAHDRRMRMGSLGEPIHAAAPKPPPRTPPPYPPPQPLRPPPSYQPPQPVEQSTQQQHFVSPIMDEDPKAERPGLARLYEVFWKGDLHCLGADFKAWGLRYLQRLGAAQQMSGGDWPEDFKLLALNGKLEGAALNYYEKMLPVWTSVSNTLEHAMNSMLMLYMTPIPATKGIEIMASEKDRNRTWPEHYQFLVYVAERSGNTEQCVLECLCKSAPAYIQTDHLQQASELVALAIDFEISMRRQGNSGAFGSSGHGGRGRGGRIPNGGRGDQGGRGGGYIARVSSVETRTCYACGEVGHIKPNCPNKSENQSSTTSNRVVLAVGTGTEADTGSWVLDSGSSVHLVREVSMLKNAMECNQICRAANNTMVRVTKVGAVELRTVVDDKEVVVDLTE
ncbi:LOW QUALITY PROTEIN: hypothetical protein PHPALM_30354, partial [Phytophthora palmivora]